MKRRFTIVLAVIMSLTLLLGQGVFAYDSYYYDDGEVGDRLFEMAKDAPTITSTDDVVKLLWDSVRSKREHTYFRAHKSLETVIEQPEEGKLGVSDDIADAFNYLKTRDYMTQQTMMFTVGQACTRRDMIRKTVTI